MLASYVRRHETAATLPTSFYGVAMRGRGWVLEGEMRLCGATAAPRPRPR